MVCVYESVVGVCRGVCVCVVGGRGRKREERAERR